MEQLFVMCVEFGRDRWVLADEVSRIVGLESDWRNMEVCKEGKVALLLEKGMEGVSDTDGGGG